MKFNFNLIGDWTVRLVNSFYHVCVINMYFIICNIVGLVALFLFELTMNNLIFFVIPIYFLLMSYIVQFQLMNEQNELSFKHFRLVYRNTLKQNWKLVLAATTFILFIIFDMKILSLSEDIAVLTIPILITAVFLFCSLLYLFLIQTRSESSALSLKKKISSSLLLSYRLPGTTLMNFFLLVFTILSIQLLPTVYVLFLGGLINSIILANLQRKFSLDLYFEQTGVSQIQ